MNFRTKPRGMWANFTTECAKCAGELTVTNGRVDPHTCRERIDMPAFQDALGDYYDSGAIGDPPKPKRLNPLTLADIDAALDNR